MQDIGNLNDLKKRLLRLNLEEINFDLKHSVDTKKYAYDPDSSLLAWEYYLVVYKDLLNVKNESDLFRENYRNTGFWIEGRMYKRIIGTFCYADDFGAKLAQWYLSDSPYLEVGKNIGVAGDCVFNFNEKKKKKFWKIIKACDDNSYGEILLLVSGLHHAAFNFSLMPMNGGLNLVKGRNVDDRPDVFLCKLSDVYDKEIKEKACENIRGSNIVKNLGLNVRNKKSNDALIDFLFKIGSFENYCKIFYHLDCSNAEEKSLVNDLITNAENDISDLKDFIRYVELAVRYWEYQVDVYKKCVKKGN